MLIDLHSITLPNFTPEYLGILSKPHPHNVELLVPASIMQLCLVLTLRLVPVLQVDRTRLPPCS